MIYIAYPDIPARAVARTPSFTLYDDYPEGNLLYGERYLRAWENVRYSPKTIDYDLGRTLSGDITSSSLYLILARADIPKASGITTTTLESDTTSAFSSPTTVHSVDLSTATLYGPNSNDYISTFSTSIARRYWRLTFTQGTACKLQLSKIYFGTPFDFGIAPTSYSWTRGPRYRAVMDTSSGAVEMGRLDEHIYTFKFTWQNVSDDTTKDFLEKIVRFSNKWRFFLYTTTTATHHLLDNKQILHCKLKGHHTENVCQNKNIITASFEEMIG